MEILVNALAPYPIDLSANRPKPLSVRTGGCVSKDDENSRCATHPPRPRWFPYALFYIPFEIELAASVEVETGLFCSGPRNCEKLWMSD